MAPEHGWNLGNNSSKGGVKSREQCVTPDGTLTFTINGISAVEKKHFKEPLFTFTCKGFTGTPILRSLHEAFLQKSRLPAQNFSSPSFVGSQFGHFLKAHQTPAWLPRSERPRKCRAGNPRRCFWSSETAKLPPPTPAQTRRWKEENLEHPFLPGMNVNANQQSQSLQKGWVCHSPPPHSFSCRLSPPPPPLPPHSPHCLFAPAQRGGRSPVSDSRIHRSKCQKGAGWPFFRGAGARCIGRRSELRSPELSDSGPAVQRRKAFDWNESSNHPWTKSVLFNW